MKMIRVGENSDTLKSWNALVFNYIVEMKKMIRGGENSVPYVPIDLVMEILSRLPSKSIARCRYVSKLWSSNILRPYFTELFLSRSLSRPPRLLLAVLGFDDWWSFFTSLQPQNQSMNLNESSLADDFQMKFPGDKRLEFCGHASGFILMRSEATVHAICNPTTGQYVSLPSPKLENTRGWTSLLGFDPIDKQLKVLIIPLGTSNRNRKDEMFQILTVGTGKDLFRNIRCPLAHKPIGEGICINGVLYYLANPWWTRCRIVSFDVRSEKFKFIQRDFIHKYGSTKLINYKGRLGVITLCRQFELCTWVIKDVNNIKSQWSKYFSISWDFKLGDVTNMFIVGVTGRGEIVLTSTKDASKPVYVVYIYPETNTFQKVEIKGLQPNHFNNLGKVVEVSRVEVFSDYVDQDLTFINLLKTTTTTSVISPPKMNHKPTTMVTSRPSGSSKPRLQQDVSCCTFESIKNCNPHKKLGVSSPWRFIDRFGFIILFFLFMMGLLIFFFFENEVY